MTHSPGPWRWERNENGAPVLLDANGKQIAHGWDDESVYVSKADGALIAAAPETKAKLDKAMAKLREFEWAAPEDITGSSCPDCAAFKTSVGQPRPGYGMHDPDCELAKLLETP